MFLAFALVSAFAHTAYQSGLEIGHGRQREWISGVDVCNQADREGKPIQGYTDVHLMASFDKGT